MLLPDGGSPVPVSLLMRQSGPKKPADATLGEVEEVEENGGGAEDEEGVYGDNTWSPTGVFLSQGEEPAEYMMWPHGLVSLHL